VSLEILCCQGREVSQEQLQWLRRWIEAHPRWSRFRLCKELCELWDWRAANGRVKTFAAKSFLTKLEQRGFIQLPAIRTSMRRQSWVRPPIEDLNLPEPQPIEDCLSQLRPLNITLLGPGSDLQPYWRACLVRYHYLGLRSIVGENLRYLISDRQHRPLACSLFGAAAWKCACRDQFIGWTPEQRQSRLHLIVGNSRFLILPWVRVKCLASTILSKITKRIDTDWRQRYGHGLELLETFVDTQRFRGTCYRAANWMSLGCTSGRTRQDRHHQINVAPKQVYVYPLGSRFGRHLCGA
jgi:hypothetical protein